MSHHMHIAQLLKPLRFISIWLMDFFSPGKLGLSQFMSLRFTSKAPTKLMLSKMRLKNEGLSYQVYFEEVSSI